MISMFICILCAHHVCLAFVCSACLYILSCIHLQRDVFETQGCYVAQNSLFSCLPCDGMTDMYYHSLFMWCWGSRASVLPNVLY